MRFIAELGSGNTCRNDVAVVKKMIDGIAEMEPGRNGIDLVFKMQLFQHEPPNTPLEHEVFAEAYDYAKKAGYIMTASVFDKPSADFLLQFDVPFVKFACRPELWKLVPYIPKEIPAYVSYPSFGGRMGKSKRVVPLACVPKYPATVIEYATRFKPKHIRMGVSDHTVGWDLVREYQPEIVEKHVVLERDENNPDAGPFAVTIEELQEVLGGTRRTHKRGRRASKEVAESGATGTEDAISTDT